MRLTRSSPLLAPVDVMMSSGKPSNCPPTLPPLRRNSSMLCLMNSRSSLITSSVITSSWHGEPAQSLPPTPPTDSGDRCLEPATAACRRVSETGFQVGEHLLAAGLGSVVRGIAQVLVRQRQFGDGAPRLAVLHQE